MRMNPDIRALRTLFMRESSGCSELSRFGEDFSQPLSPVIS